jgi:hypothetical protein
MKKLFVIIIFSIFAITNISISETIIDSGKIVFKGFVKNDKNKKINGVLITLLNVNNNKKNETITSANGEFEFQVISGTYNISAVKEEYITYEEKGLKLDSNYNRIYEILMIEKNYVTDIIDVESQYRQNQEDLRTSLFNINPTSIKILPGAVEDVFRSLKALPGVSSPNDFTSQLIIRGSGPDQNLIIMDDVEIFNPYRLYGLISMFNPETLIDINLITGGFPAKYGDRLSAVLDVTNKEGIREKSLSMFANINIANANIIMQGKNPLNFPGSWIISTRRTYYDLILGPFAKKAGLITDNSSFPSFQDLQFKVSIGSFGKHKLIVNGIFSKDGVDIISGKDRSDPDSVNVNDVTKNNLLSVGWHYIPNTNFISKTTFSWYNNKGQNDFEGDILDPLIDKENLTPAQRDSLKAIGALLGFNFSSAYDFIKYSLGNKSIFKFKNNLFEFGGGIDFIRTDISYKLKLDDNFKAFLSSLPGYSALMEDFTIRGKDNIRINSYSLVRIQFLKKYFIQPSLRIDYYSFLGKVYLSPRINFGYAISPVTTLRVSTGYYYQSPGYEKLIDGQTFFDLSKNYQGQLEAEKAIHIVAGIDHWLNSEWYLKFESYIKLFSNLIVQQKLTGYKYKYYLTNPNNNDPNYLRNVNNWERSPEKLPFDSLTSIPVNSGTGKSYGFEISIEKKYTSARTKLYGWINYSLSYSDRTKYDITNPFRFDQRHILNVVLNYKISNTFELGLRWSFATNFPFTKPIGITPRIAFDSLVVNPFTNQVVFNLDYGGTENKFASRKPDYHRLDLRFSAYTKFFKLDWTFYIDIINVYNRKNVLGYDYYIDSQLKVRQKVIGMIPILPTIGFSAKF